MQFLDLAKGVSCHMDKNHFLEYSRYYDLMYKDKDYLGEVNYVYSKLVNLLPNITNILEIGTGTGIHASMLKKNSLM